MMLMRWQLAYPGRRSPGSRLLGDARMPGGVMLPEFYNELGAMHDHGFPVVRSRSGRSSCAAAQISAPDMVSRA
jgi:hypothetical protein